MEKEHEIHQIVQQPKHSQPSLRKTVAASAIISVLLGGAVGGASGYWMAKNTPSSSTQQAGLTTGTLSVQEESATTDVVKKNAPAVVSVVLTQDLSKVRQANPFFNFFGFPSDQQSGQQQVGAGTGFLVSADGLVLTNRHVVDATNVDFTVVFNDGSEHKAQVLGVDPLNDLAVLKIDGKSLPTVQLGDSDSLTLGQTVIAIGNALGEFQNTVTKGVVSGINRTITAGDSSGAAETISDAIQTDAAINPGNSGGPLLDLAGKVVGVNTAVSQQGQLVGFSIPINVAKQVIDSVQKYGKIVRPYLGVRYLTINDEVKQANNLSVDYGALVVPGQSATDVAVIPASPADKAGIVENDIILEFNDKKITSDQTLSSFMLKAKVGDQVKLKILHKGEEKTVTVTLEEYTSTSNNG
ncbi:MAG: trypsin-like peptidase domain-containing protein [bacterium]